MTDAWASTSVVNDELQEILADIAALDPMDPDYADDLAALRAEQYRLQRLIAIRRRRAALLGQERD